ncbi:MAG: hypothetical protein COT43_05810 [Candidatus Marinimicrobia bacterium CG08_land_8_20_14_0_20_45_22]|nr:MAG: hypothetical protein COT43_05810 [Candidatus Marinimicrobia bacterium CG08_land_8_20_14_0_20_45_22]
MKKFFVQLILILTFYFVTFTPLTCLYSVGGSAKIYFDKGVQEYLQGNTDAAIKNIEDGLAIEKDNKKMQALFIKLLIEQGTRFYEQKQYNDAVPYLKKAVKYIPENKDIQDMIYLCEKQLRPQQQVIALQGGATGAAGGLVVIGGGSDEKMMSKLFDSVQQQQSKLIEAYTEPQDTLRTLIGKSDEERARLMEILNKKDEALGSAMKGQRSTLLITIGAGVLIFGVIFFLVYYGMSRAAARREAVLVQQQEKILGMVYQQNIALTQGNMQLRLANQPNVPQLEAPGITPKEMLNDPNARIRAKGIEVIEAELVNEDASVAEKILKPFFEDKDNRVRANAAKILYKFNPEASMEFLNGMINDTDKWTRASGFWALGEIGTDGTLNILIDKINEPDYHIKRMILRSIKKTIATKKSEIPDETIKKAKEELLKIQKTEKWII